MLSILSSSQKYKVLPLSFRVVTSIIITFRLAPSEYKSISEELVYSNIDFEQMVSNAFTNDKNFIIYNANNGKFYVEFEETNN
tara:strand:+ start:9805 stop:10053 length:249 start_codon:yes stop_codon:yes gene_type:complete